MSFRDFVSAVERLAPAAAAARREVEGLAGAERILGNAAEEAIKKGSSGQGGRSGTVTKHEQSGVVLGPDGRPIYAPGALAGNSMFTGRGAITGTLMAEINAIMRGGDIGRGGGSGAFGSGGGGGGMGLGLAGAGGAFGSGTSGRGPGSTGAGRGGGYGPIVGGYQVGGPSPTSAAGLSPATSPATAQAIVETRDLMRDLVKEVRSRPRDNGTGLKREGLLG